jgi:phage baseplate assembly protein W
MARTVIKGISWPFRKEGKGVPAQAVGIDVYRSALIALIKTPVRSRVMRPTLGTRILNYICEVNGPFLVDVIKREIAMSIADNLPQINIINIDVLNNDKVVEINIIYSVSGIVDQTGNISLNK